MPLLFRVGEHTHLSEMHLRRLSSFRTSDLQLNRWVIYVGVIPRKLEKNATPRGFSRPTQRWGRCLPPGLFSQAEIAPVEIVFNRAEEESLYHSRVNAGLYDHFEMGTKIFPPFCRFYRRVCRRVRKKLTTLYSESLKAQRQIL